MARIGFIGLGNMGLPMASNLVKAGHAVLGLDLSLAAMDKLVAAGGRAVSCVEEAVAQAELVLTMLPEGSHVAAVYAGDGGILARAPADALLVDCSTIDVETSRRLHEEVEATGRAMLDAPVSGGTAGALSATLTFMVGGSDAAFARARPVLESMGRTIVLAGGPGAGQAAKVCNNMILGISMIAVAEAFALADRLGLAADRLFEVSSQSSGQCWSMTSYCPVPGLVPAAPANRGFAPGFTTAMMLKDLRLAQAAAASVQAPTPLGAAATQLYALFAAEGAAADFSAIIKMFEPEKA